MKPEHMDHPALEGQRCPGCGRHCPATDPSCGRGVAFRERLIAEYDRPAPTFEPGAAYTRTPMLFDSIEEAEAYRRQQAGRG